MWAAPKNILRKENTMTKILSPQILLIAALKEMGLLFPETDKEVDEFISNPDNKVSDKEMLEYFYASYPGLIIRCAEAEKQLNGAEAKLAQRDGMLGKAKEGLEFYANCNTYLPDSEIRRIAKLNLTALEGVELDKPEGVWLSEENREYVEDIIKDSCKHLGDCDRGTPGCCEGDGRLGFTMNDCSIRKALAILRGGQWRQNNE